MKNKKMIITVVACIVAVLVIALALYLWDKKAKTTEVISVTDPQTGAVTKTTVLKSNTAPVFPLKMGSKNDKVKALQIKLNQWMNYNYIALTVKPKTQQIAVDGDYGVQTNQFVKMALKTDGVTETAYNAFMASVIVQSDNYPKLY